ncbi:hypothetical protein M3Y99_00161100 [Aphelenchoides fujianensis]|nr:hypothetical protein M3Y99_00161100 [Aphelenchoides fujianensis]
MLPVKEALEKIQAAHPYRVEKLVVCKLPGVRVMPPKWKRELLACKGVWQSATTTASTFQPTAAEAPVEPKSSDSSTEARADRHDDEHVRRSVLSPLGLSQPSVGPPLAHGDRPLSEFLYNAATSQFEPCVKESPGKFDVTECSATSLKIQWGRFMTIELHVGALYPSDTVEWTLGNDCKVAVKGGVGRTEHWATLQITRDGKLVSMNNGTTFCDERSWRKKTAEGWWWTRVGFNKNAAGAIRWAWIYANHDQHNDFHVNDPIDGKRVFQFGDRTFADGWTQLTSKPLGLILGVGVKDITTADFGEYRV